MPEWLNVLHNLFFRFADRIVPPNWFLSHLPTADEVNSYTGRLTIEIVSHCWNYSHLLAYNLSSLVNHPPRDVDVTITVFYSPEDQDTIDMLEYFSDFEISGVEWNWQQLSTEQLLRRAIGRNKAALETKADWIWFIDCDLIFHHGWSKGSLNPMSQKLNLLILPKNGVFRMRI